MKERRWDIPDWSREQPMKFWDPGRKLLRAIRGYQKVKDSMNLIDNTRKYVYIIKHRFWSVVTGAEIDLLCDIGGGLLIPHPNGIIIHPDSIIGANCLIFQQVTLAGKVTLGNHVDIGAGAKILGPINICSNVLIGANAVVTKDIIEPGTYVGIPAEKIIKD